MRKIYTIFLAILLTVNVVAQPPLKMSYQAVIRDANNVLVINGVVGMRISILQGSIVGTPVYMESQNPTTNANGLVSIEIGAYYPDMGSFASIDWSSGPYYIKTETDPTGGANYTITGTSQLLTVPYAMYANSSKYLTNFNVSATGDTMSFGKTNVIIPGISIINHPPVTDADGNSYKTILIGKQIWMAENLKTTKYNDGTDIPLVTNDSIWSTLTTHAYCWYNNDINNKNIYGALYNWYVVNTGKLCPTGWHVPTIDEWRILGDPYKYTRINISGTYGFELMESGTSHWLNGSGTNETGFTALPRGPDNQYGSYWSSNYNDMYHGVWFYPIPIDDSWGKTPLSSLRLPQEKFSVRCVKN